MSRDFTLFIVDDAKSARILLESAFGQECRVESFATAEDCLARMQQDDCAPDLFLLDVDLPGMDGYTLCREIKDLPGLDNVPVIFISSLDDLESRLEGYDAGGLDYVIKPYNLAELKQKVGAARRLSSATATPRAPCSIRCSPCCARTNCIPSFNSACRALN